MRDELGVRYVMCWMNMGGLEPDKVLRSMQLFATEVMPRFKDKRSQEPGARSQSLGV